MGADPISTASPTTVIKSSVFNKIVSALKSDLAPRNSSGIATSLAGSLGTSTIKWMRAYIESGYWTAGDIKSHHSYNGAVGPGHGWMLCDGRQVTQAAYDTEHGAGSWATYIGTTPLLNKYLPNLIEKYQVGKSSTTETGAAPMASVGNSGNTIQLAHTHTAPNHAHIWYSPNAPTVNDTSYNSNGVTDGISTNSKSGGRGLVVATSGSGLGMASGNGNLLTSTGGAAATSSALSFTSIQPESIEVQFYMRII